MASPDDAGARAPRAFGRRLVLIVLGVAVVPLGLFGLWATGGASRSGRNLLRSQLDGQLAVLTGDVAQSWERVRADLLTLGESEPVRRVLTESSSVVPSVPQFVRQAFDQTMALERVVVRDRARRVRFSLSSPTTLADSAGQSAGTAAEPVITMQLPITDLLNGDTVGTIEGMVRLTALVPQLAGPLVRRGPLLAVTSPTGILVRQGEADERVFVDEAVEWEGERWTTVRREVPQTSIALALAGALSPYEAPFKRAARRSALMLFVAASLAAIAVLLLTRRLTQGVERQLAQREALAAVGEFASELAHEVRNPLTAMRLDLQRAEERVDDAATLRAVLPRVLGQVDRLDRAVSGALRIARSGAVEPQLTDLAPLLEAARRSAEPEFARRGARLVVQPVTASAMQLAGDAGALEQVFLNLMINAAQALSAGGEARVATTKRDGHLEVTIRDDGAGMTASQLAEIAQPFRSSRRDGTGLGIRIARRIVTSHGGTVTFSSAPSAGTTVLVRLPIPR